ncbi:MAG: hypothetical protein GTO03_17935 [Planctomycetales bacterium]|nr:hypothetical protein [Planctomycetales bacterium]
MRSSISPAKQQVRFRIRRDLRTIKKVLRQIRQSEHLASHCLFGRRTEARLLDHVERRVAQRAPLELPIYVTVADYDGRDAVVWEIEGGEALAITKDVSLRGVGFTHEEPFEGDYALVTFELLDAEPISLLVEMRWTNLVRGRLYLSGGRFVGIPIPCAD